MTAHYCVGNPCWICFPEYAPKGNVMFFQKIELEDNKIWIMKYKDVDSDEAPWIIWNSTDKPSDLFMDALKNEGFYRLQLVQNV